VRSVARDIPVDAQRQGTTDRYAVVQAIVPRLTVLLVASGMCLTIDACASQRDDGDDAGAGTPRCEHTVSMEVPTEVALGAATSGCLHEEGQLTRYETTTIHCADGRVLHWNETGWGYDSDTWHPRELNQTVPVPPEERSACER
jgi:hypothetical protein